MHRSSAGTCSPSPSGDSTQREIRTIGPYSVVRQIGSGSFGKVYLAYDQKRNKVAVKTESLEVATPRLMKENQIYSLLVGVVGYPRVHHYGQADNSSILVLDAMGPSLDNLFIRCGRRFSLKTVLMLAEQILNRVEYLHSKFFLHRDIKPANFVMGNGHYDHIVHMIDFGLSERFCDYTMKHTPNKGRHGVGTPLFSSTNSHFKHTPSRRDDMESIAIMLIFFLQGGLPWEGMKGRKVSHTWDRIAEKKVTTSIEELCEGLPDEFSIFLEYCRKLEYEEKPDYQFIRVLFRLLAKKMNYEYDCEYDWSKKDWEFVRMPPQQLSLVLPGGAQDHASAEPGQPSTTGAMKDLNLTDK